MATGTFDQYLQNHLADVAAGRVMRLPDSTLRSRWQGDWSRGLNASEMFRDQTNTLNRAPNPGVYNRAPGSAPQAMPRQTVQPQPVGQPTTFTGPTGQSGTQTGGAAALPTQGGSLAATSGMSPQAGNQPTNSSTGTAYGPNYGDPNREGTAFGAQRVGTYGQNPSQGSIFGETNIGLAGAENAMQGGLMGALNTVGMGYDQGRGDLTQAGAGANNTLNRYYQPGYQANDYQAALSGALGGQAQSDAMARFQNSPGQQYLINESERAIRRNAAATGGAQGANVLRALQENAIGLAAQDFNNAYNRLGQVSDRGLSAGGQIAGNTMQTGSALANLGVGNAAQAANMIYGTGNNMAAGRTRAGEQIANNVQGTSQALANQNFNTGQALSGVQQQGASQLANLLAGYGRDDLQSNAQLATILANLATGAGTTVAGLPTLGGIQQTDGALGDIGNIASGLGALGVSLSDARLKKNIKKLGEYRGANIYSWDWRDPSISQPSVGVIAQEHPEHAVMGDDGYLRVNYGALFNG